MWASLAIASRRACSKERGWTSNSSMPDGSVMVVSVESPSINGLAMPASTGVTSPIQCDAIYPEEAHRYRGFRAQVRVRRRPRSEIRKGCARHRRHRLQLSPSQGRAAPALRAASWRRTPKSRSGLRRPASSASDTRWPARPRSMPCSAVPRPPGATLTDRPHDRPWGIYSGYFRDPDEHLWEVLYNPRLVQPQE